MLQVYNTNSMSTRCKAIFERGRFFIESGSGKGFSLFLKDGEGFTKYIPLFILNRIGSLIDAGEIDMAVALWLKACESADKAPAMLFIKSFHITVHAIEFAMGSAILYMFWRLLHS
jgi:hypothetical protein